MEKKPQVARSLTGPVRLLIGCVATLLCSCATHNKDGSVSRHYFGYTVVKFPRQVSNHDGFDIKEISNVGFAVGRPAGVSLGYTKDKIVSMPLDGRLYVEVHTEEQFEKAKNLIRELEKIGVGVSYSDKEPSQYISKK